MSAFPYAPRERVDNETHDREPRLSRAQSFAVIAGLSLFAWASAIWVAIAAWRVL
jgi:hypothetical protein